MNAASTWFDAFHLELSYNDPSHELSIRVTITGETATELGPTPLRIAPASDATAPVSALNRYRQPAP